MISTWQAPIRSFFEIVDEKTRETVEDPAEKACRSGVAVDLTNHMVLISRDGREFPVANYGSPIFDDCAEVTGAVLVFRDMTRRRRIENELHEANRH